MRDVYSCKCCGADLTSEVGSIEQFGIEDAELGGICEELECEACGAVYEVDVSVSVYVSVKKISDADPAKIFFATDKQPGLSYKVGNQVLVFDEEGAISEAWRAPDDNQVALPL